jgi:hypothetical protein
MVLMPLFFVRLGVKWMLLVGMFAWVLRYGLFAGAAGNGVLWMILGGILLHGICYDFFFVTGFIYVDKQATKKIRGQAQGLLVLITQGLGMLIGAQVIGRLVNRYTPATHDALLAGANELKAQAIAATGVEAQSLWVLWEQASEAVLAARDWQTIWLIPCIMAAVVAVAFMLLFREDSRAAQERNDKI